MRVKAPNPAQIPMRKMPMLIDEQKTIKVRSGLGGSGDFSVPNIRACCT